MLRKGEDDIQNRKEKCSPRNKNRPLSLKNSVLFLYIGYTYNVELFHNLDRYL